ncbi:MAG: helix-turn-helix transcriptional regulator [Clostridia bacterium]|nr:helix-turn-helix transcriptional regulator [Clostridia bacterium]
MKFKELLKEKDFNGSQIARRLGLSRTAVSSWVRGKSAPSYTHLVKMAKILDVSLETLVRCFAEEEKA